MRRNNQGAGIVLSLRSLVQSVGRWERLWKHTVINDIKKAVAEGIETSEQLLMLKSYQCDYLQGYYFSKPLPAEEFEMLLRNKEQGYASCKD